MPPSIDCNAGETCLSRMTACGTFNVMQVISQSQTSSLRRRQSVVGGFGRILSDSSDTGIQADSVGVVSDALMN